MMGFPDRRTVERLRNDYKPGQRVVLTCMDDDQAPPIGTKGTVRGVDDSGSILVSWDNGSSLNVIYGVDSCRKLDSVKVTCYGKTEVWDSRKEAEDFYLGAMAATEGSESERYSKIYTELLMGLEVCSDEH